MPDCRESTVAVRHLAVRGIYERDPKESLKNKAVAEETGGYLIASNDTIHALTYPPERNIS